MIWLGAALGVFAITVVLAPAINWIVWRDEISLRDSYRIAIKGCRR